jgi:hypothetical protein
VRLAGSPHGLVWWPRRGAPRRERLSRSARQLATWRVPRAHSTLRTQQRVKQWELAAHIKRGQGPAVVLGTEWCVWVRTLTAGSRVGARA